MAAATGDLGSPKTIGDAEAYILEENNIDDWRVELSRLRDEIISMSSAKATPESFQALRVIRNACHRGETTGRVERQGPQIG